MRISILYTVTNEILNINVHPDNNVEIIKKAIYFETNLDPIRQLISFRTRILINSDQIKNVGIKENDVLYLDILQPLDIRKPLGSIDLGTISASNLQRYILNHLQLLQYIKEKIPDLHKTVVAKTDLQMEVYLRPLREKIISKRREIQQNEKERKLRARLVLNPMDLDAQKELEAEIRKRNVEENLQNAMTYKPELFGRVYMLYIPVKINGRDLKAFVDTGAQTTLMSSTCAERCNIMRLCDTKFRGIAKGVGTAVILGRVHLVQFQIGKSFFEHSLTILDQKNDIDIILGLDFLRSHKVIIDLSKNLFIVGKETMPFLGESDIPKLPYNAQVMNKKPGGDKNNQNPSSSGSSSQQGQQQMQSQQISNEQKIKNLMNLGVSKQIAVDALQKCQGNVEIAATYILQQMNIH